MDTGAREQIEARFPGLRDGDEGLDAEEGRDRRGEAGDGARGGGGADGDGQRDGDGCAASGAKHRPFGDGALGAGGVGLLLGVVAGGVAVAGNNDLSKKCSASGACPKSASGEVATTVALTHVSTAGFVLAGLGVAVGVTLFSFRQRRATRTGRLSRSVRVSLV